MSLLFSILSILVGSFFPLACDAPAPGNRLEAARLSLERGDYLRARGLLLEELSISPLDDESRAEIHAEIALTYLHAGQTDSVVSHLQEAISLDPGEPSYHFNLASVFLDANRADLSLASAQQAVSLDSTDLDSWRLLSASAAKTGNLPLAEEAVLKALSLDSTQADLWNSYGSVLMAEGRLSEAESAFLRGLDSEDPENMLLLNLMSLARLQGDSLKAEEYSRKYGDRRRSIR